MDDKNNFIKGTLILAIANVISKILGAVFKIPLTYILKEEGMAIFNTASTVYSLFLTVVISGIPLATSRLVSSDTALNRHPDVIKTVSASRRLLCLIGGILSIVLFFIATPIAIAMKDPAAAHAIRIISPSIFFVAWGNAYKSYFQGTSKMIPSALSQVLESILRLAVGYLLALMFINSTTGVTAAAATSGITAGEIFATLLLGGMYFFSARKIKEKSTLGYKKIYSLILSVAIPMFICSLTLSMLNILDTATVRNQLLRIRFTPDTAKAFLLKYSSYTSLFDNLLSELKLSAEGARWLYGAYSGYALTVFHLPIGMIATLSVSILPLIAGNIAKNNISGVRSSVNTAVNLTLFCAVPAVVILFSSAEDILKLLFNNTASAHMLQIVSPCLIFICLSQIFTSVFHAAGRIYEPFFIQLAGIFIKVSGNFVLIKIPGLNIDGAILSSTVAFFFITVASGILLSKTFGINYKLKYILPPFISAIPMYAVIRLIQSPMYCIFPNTIFAFLITVFTAAVSYILSMSLLSPAGLPIQFIKQKNRDNKFFS